MTRDEIWDRHCRQLAEFMSANQRRPSKYYPEERAMHEWLRHNRRLMQRGKLQPDRTARLSTLLQLAARYRRLNQYA